MGGSSHSCELMADSQYTDVPAVLSVSCSKAVVVRQLTLCIVSRRYTNGSVSACYEMDDIQ